MYRPLSISKSHWLASLSILGACQGPTGSAAASRSGQPDNVAGYEAAIHRTLESVHADLVGLKAEFPQLSEIESARVGRSEGAWGAELSYEKGVGPQTILKAPEPEFAPGGCWISIDLIGYHPEKDPEIAARVAMDARVLAIYELQHGFRYAVSSPVIAETSAPGRKFTERVGAVIRTRLEALHVELQARKLPVTRAGS